MTSAIPVQCSNKWLIKPTGSWLWGEYIICPKIVRNATGYMKDYIFPLQRKIWRHDWSSQLCTQLLKFPRYYVLIDWARGPDRKIFGLRSGRMVRVQRGPSALSQIISRLAWPHSVNKHFIIWPLFVFIFIFLVERGRAPQHYFVSCAFSKSQWFHAIHFLSLWSVLQPQVVYKLKNTNTLTKFWSKRSHFDKCHLNFLTAESRDHLY